MLVIGDLNRQLLKALNEQLVEYLVVGGTAVRFYRTDRPAGDLDVLVDRSPDNVERLKNALVSQGVQNAHSADFSKLTKSKAIYFPLKGLSTRYGESFNVDILTSPGCFDFNSAFENRVMSVSKGISVPIISCCDLIRHKSTSEQEKDMDDVRRLRIVCADCD